MALLLLGACLLASTAAAQTAPHLAGPKATRVITLDGFTSEWLPSEELFCTSRTDGDSCANITAGEESDADSKWGVDNDLNQIRITWDADNLYLGLEGVISGNNMIVWIQSSGSNFPIPAMTALASWRRNFTFANGFGPNLFAATWDGNTTPQVWSTRSGILSQITDSCRTVATFSGKQRARAMEVAIPWSKLFPTSQSIVTVDGVTDTFNLLPPGSRIRIAGAITAGGDGTGGPDTAPDVTRCLTSDGNANVVVDNFAEVEFDRKNDLGLPGLGPDSPDGMPDWGIKPRDRVSFNFQPPLRGLCLVLDDMSVKRPSFAPQRGQAAPFTFTISPKLDPNDPIQRVQTVTVSANIYDLGGRFIRNLYVGDTRPAVSLNPGETWPVNPARDQWNGRDGNGELVPPGIYVFRLVLEPNVSRLTRPMVVVR